MVATGYSTLKRNTALSVVMTVALAGCTSVEYAPQHQLAANQKTLPVKTAAATQVGYAAPQTATGTVAAAQTLSGVAQPGATQQAMPTTVAAKTSRLVQQPNQTTTVQVAATRFAPPATAQPQNGAEAMSAAFAEMPLTDEVTALQSVIPMKRPDAPYATRQSETTPQLAYAAAPVSAARAFSSMNTMSDFDTRTAKEIESRMSALPDEDSPKAKGGPAVDNSMLKKLITKYASLYQVPESLVHRVVRRESTYNPKAYSRGNYGLMQIRYNTARAMGYDGPASGLFDAETNLKYAVKYLRGAWLTADTDHDGAVRLYASGYYNTAKRKGLLNQVQ